MNLFISMQHPDQNGAVERRFGRCAWLLQHHVEAGTWQAHENPGVAQSGGAGVAAAQFVIQHKADAVISGDFGPNAARALRAAGIRMLLIGEGAPTAAQVVELYKAGSLKVFEYTGQ